MMQLIVQRTRAAAMIATVDEFLAMELPEGKSELVRGEVRLTPPAGAPHGRAGTNLLLMLGVFGKESGIGSAFGDGVGYELVRIPHTVRVPDASFVRAERIPRDGVGPGLFKFAPDLAIEVLSPSESASDLQEKLDDYAIAGTQLLWVVDPRRRTVMVVSADAPVRWLQEADTLDGGNVVPGFTCPVADLFEGIARTG